MAPSMKTYSGSCDCEKVTFQATFDLSAGSFKCNCRICTKSRFWAVSVESQNMKLLTGQDDLIRYWTNPIHHICKHCGVKVFGRGQSPNGKTSYAVPLSVLDDLDPREWVKVPVVYFDGRHDRFDREPEFKDHL